MSNKGNRGKAIALILIILLGAGSLSGCGFNTKSVHNSEDVTFKQTASSPSNQKGNDGAVSSISDMAEREDTKQEDETAAFMKIEPAILKGSQNSTYTYDKGKLSFTIESEKVDFPSKYISTIFNPHADFMPSSIFISSDKIAVVRTPDDDSIVITYSDDNGKTWQDSSAIHTEQIPDHAIADSDFLDRNEVDSLLSLYVDFTSKATGFLIIGSGTTMGTQYTCALFKTTDGGKNWNAIDSNIGFIHSFPITGMYFMDDKNGFIVLSGLNVKEAKICQTIDGGITWSTSKLPVPATFADNLNIPNIIALAPYYVSSQWFLPMYVRPDTLIYFNSKDQGKTWSYDSAMNIKVDQFLIFNAS